MLKTISYVNDMQHDGLDKVTTNKIRKIEHRVNTSKLPRRNNKSFNSTKAPTNNINRSVSYRNSNCYTSSYQQQQQQQKQTHIQILNISNSEQNLKTSIYDWDSPSSYTGTVKRRPHSLTRNVTVTLLPITIPSSVVTKSAVKTTSSPETTTIFDHDEFHTSKAIASHSSIGKTKSLKSLSAGQVTDNSNNNNHTSQVQNTQHFIEESVWKCQTICGNTYSKNIVSSFRLPATGSNFNDSYDIPKALSSSKTEIMSNMQKSQHGNKEKPSKLRFAKAPADRNANSTTSSPTTGATDVATIVGGTIRKSSKVSSLSKAAQYRNVENVPKKSKTLNSIERTYHTENSAPTEAAAATAFRHGNYLELNFYDAAYSCAEAAQFTELFCDFPVCYETTAVITATQFVKNSLVTKPPPQPPPYREPPPPTPPPISHMPTRESRLLSQHQNTHDTGISLSAPATPSRGKVVLSKKERKELSKLSKLQDSSNSINSNTNLAGFELNDASATGGSVSVQSSPYKGRVTELKNCIAKINSKGLFASLNRNSQKAVSNNTDDPPSSNEASPPPPAPDNSPPSSTTSNNNDADYTEKLKNLPVRQRKAHISHMDNYCLFDPVDFLNEKALRGRTLENLEYNISAHACGLRDPLFSSRQNLDFSEEESVPEVIYDDQQAEFELEIEEACGGINTQNNFEHHNYFVIDPEDFEKEPILDIGIPNPYTNEQLINAKMETADNKVDSMLPNSCSFEKLLDAFEAPPSMSNSQESKDTNTTTSTTTTTSTALVESSTSTNSSSSSSSSATSSQTTLKRTKKKLTFLNLSPFRSHSSKQANTDNNSGGAGNSNNSSKKSADNRVTERAVSELVSSDHMLHLQHMLLDGKENLRSRTVPIESNYVLFNPGPVPSRNVQYKIRKPRPLSTHSDADSGFLSPCSPDELSSLKFNPAILVLQQCDSVQGYIEIYTDWANYYLERAKSKKKVIDLSADCRDGLLLADVIEAVTSFKVPDLVKKPKNQQQMYENVNSCLNVLRIQAVGGLDNITTSDICAGRLKAVLALFFALSRFKQQSKQIKQPQTNSTTPNANVVLSTTQSGGNQQQQQQQQHAQSVQNGNDTMVNRQIPTAYSKANGGTAIPLPATVMVQRRCPPDKVRPLPPTPNHTPSIPGLGKSGSDFNTSRPNSPPTSNHTIQSLKSGNNNGLRPPSGKTAHQSGIPPPSASNAVAVAAPQQTKHSMLDKLKLFNKEKQQQNSNITATNKQTQAQSKRTSSSSGFSSARSERSDSSLSLNDGHISQIKPPAVNVTANKTRDAKNNTKQSKLLAAQIKKEHAKASKLEKKEKSPARSLNKEDINADSKNSTIGRTKNSLPRVIEKNSAKTSSKSSLNSKSESKTSLIMPTTKTLNSPNGSTGLPKPIAAIKGTSKLPQPGDNKQRMSNSNSNNDMLKREKSDISTSTTNNISERREHDMHRNMQATPTTHIVKPVPILPEPGSKPPFYANTTNISSPTRAQNIMLEANAQSRTTAQDIIYSRLPPPKSTMTTTTRKLEYSAGPNILSPQRSPMRTMNQLSHSQPESPISSPNKFHTIPTKIVGTIYEEEKPVNVLPMRPLLRGYNSHVTLPTRGPRGTHSYVNDFCENDIGQGYCSDGDALRIANTRLAHGPAAASSRYHDIDNGYLSEGSGGLGLSGAGVHGKHFLSLMRARTQLPTTIEERIRSSRGSLDSIGTAPPSSGASQASSSGGSNNKMDATNGCGSGNGSVNASPQHHHGQHASPRSSTRSSGRDNWSKMPEPLNGHKTEKSSPSHTRRSISGSSGGMGSGNSSSNGSPSKQNSTAGRTKGVPPSFGYVKRANGSATATAEQQNITMMMSGGSSGGISVQTNNGVGQCGRTAHVSAVPRTAGGRKISGGTQTLPNEMTKMPTSTQHRSFSLTGPSATQLSQSIRERLATGSHSLPKPGTDLHMFQHRLSNRPAKMIDGSLSDTQTYAEVKPEYSTYAMWLKHSNTAGSRLSEGDSLENMQIGSPAMTRHSHKMLQHRNAAAAAVAVANAAVANAQGGAVAGTESPYVQSPRLNRSNSIRSTKSEKMYPSMLSRGPDVEIEPYYCLPVGTIAAQNGVISVQMAAAAAAAASHVNTQTTGVAPVVWSQPTSPTPINRGFAGTLSPTHAANAVLGLTGLTSATTGGHRLTYPKKNDEVHGSAASLLSGGSSLYGSAEERQANEIRRLKRELMDAREQVLSLSSQLSTNAHVVAAFEQSLSNMTSRLQQLTATAERKDGELTDMRQTIELLRKQSIQAGLTTAHMQSMGVQTQGQDQNDLLGNKPPPLPPCIPGQHISRVAQHQQQQQPGSVGNNNNGAIQRHHSSDSMCSLNSISSGCSAQDKKKKKGWLRSSFTKAFSRNAKISKTSRHAGHHGAHSGHGDSTHNTGPHSGLTKANGHAHGEPVGLSALATQPAPPIPTSPTKCSPAKTVTLIDNAKPIDAIEHDDHQVVEELKKQLREKDLVLTDIRLEALSSASQLESLKETVNKMRAEMLSLKQNNERLQKLVTSRSLAGSEASLGNAISPNGSIGESRRYSLADGNSRPPMELPKRLEEEVEEENIPPAPAPEPPPPPLSPTTHIDLTPPPPALEGISSPAHIPTTVEELPDVTDGKKIAIACYLGQPESFVKYCEEMLEVDEFYANSSMASSIDKDSNERMSFPTASPNEFVIAYTYISGKTTWQNLDYIVRKTFKDYVSRIDPGTNLGLNTDSITSYHLGEAKRGPEMGFPELLPCGYIIGNVRTLYICLQGVGSLAFDSLIPRSIVHRYISLLTEHRRLILCGPSGTGKSYLARRLAEFLVARSGRGNPSEAIATFNVDHKSSKELRQYLGHIAEQAAIANGASELPSVIILDNLHHASALGEVFSCLLSAGPAAKLPCIIGTMSQATCNTTNLQLHHNFRWVLTANHMEPVKGFLGRFLRRRLFQLELQTQHPQPELATVLAWLPTVWQHINRFLETHSSSDVTIGPRLFLTCPLDLKNSQIWFTDIWNYHLSPYLVEAVREGVQLYGRRGGAWNDPSAFIRNSYPWPYGPDSVPPLRQINAEDVGLEGVAANNSESQDPLLNMLIRLQEAANYSENQEQESDCASLDSNITPDSSAGAE